MPMSKYQLAQRCIDRAVEGAAELHLTRDEILETIIVSAVEALKNAAGAKRAADALRYELSNLGGEVDTVFLRSR